MYQLSRRQVVGAITTGLLTSVAGCLGEPPSDEELDLPSSLSPPALGDPTIQHELLVFTDLESPQSIRFKREVTGHIVEDHVSQGDVRYVHRDFPTRTEWSWTIANAARAVQYRYGTSAFFDFIMDVAEYRGEYSTEAITSVVADHELDESFVMEVVEEDAFRNVLEEDKADGEALGVDTTPTVYLEGEMFTFSDDATGPEMEETVSDAIDRLV